MKVAPVSADLLVKIALAAMVVGAVVYGVKKLGGGLSGLSASLPPLDNFNPASDQNYAYQGTNAIVQSLTGDSTATLGTWWYGVVNPGALAAERAALAPSLMYNDKRQIDRVIEREAANYYPPLDFGGFGAFG